MSSDLTDEATERFAIAGLLQGGEGHFEPEWFTQPPLLCVAEAVRACHDCAEEDLFDAVTDYLGRTAFDAGLDPSLPANNQLEFIGGVAALCQLDRNEPHKERLRGYLKRLRELHERRMCLRVFNEAVSGLRDGTRSVDSLLSRVEGLRDVLGGGETTGVSAESALHALANRNPEDSRVVGSWGIDAMNRILPLRRNALTVVAARPGSGKTSLACQVAVASAERNGYSSGTTLMFSLEMDQEQVASKIIGQMTQNSSSVYWDGHGKDEARTVAEDIKDSIVIEDAGTQTPESIVAKARQHFRRYKDAKVVIVDYVQIISGRQEHDRERIGAAMRMLRALRKELGCQVVALSQFNRCMEGDGQTVRKPRLSDLKGAGNIEEDADAVCGIHLLGELGAPQREGQLLVLKNRYGSPGDIDVTFMGASGERFVDRYNPYSQHT